MATKHPIFLKSILAFKTNDPKIIFQIWKTQLPNHFSNAYRSTTYNFPTCCGVLCNYVSILSRRQNRSDFALNSCMLKFELWLNILSAELLSLQRRKEIGISINLHVQFPISCFSENKTISIWMQKEKSLLYILTQLYPGHSLLVEVRWERQLNLPKSFPGNWN